MWQTILDDFQNFVKRPFRSDMDLLSLFLVIGGIMVAIVLWSRILAHMGE